MDTAVMNLCNEQNMTLKLCCMYCPRICYGLLSCQGQRIMSVYRLSEEKELPIEWQHHVLQVKSLPKNFKMIERINILYINERVTKGIKFKSNMILYQSNYVKKLQLDINPQLDDKFHHLENSRMSKPNSFQNIILILWHLPIKNIVKDKKNCKQTHHSTMVFQPTKYTVRNFKIIQDLKIL